MSKRIPKPKGDPSAVKTPVKIGNRVVAMTDAQVRDLLKRGKR